MTNNAEYYSHISNFHKALRERELHRLELEKEKLARVQRREKRHEQLRVKIKVLHEELVQEEIASTQRIALLLSKVDSVQREYKLLEARTERLRHKKHQYEILLRNPHPGFPANEGVGYGPLSFPESVGESSERLGVQSHGVGYLQPLYPLRGYKYQDPNVMYQLSPMPSHTHMPMQSQPDRRPARESVAMLPNQDRNLSNQHTLPPQHPDSRFKVPDQQKVHFLTSDVNNSGYSTYNEHDFKMVSNNVNYSASGGSIDPENHMYINNRSSIEGTMEKLPQKQEQLGFLHHLPHGNEITETQSHATESNEEIVRKDSMQPYPSSLYSQTVILEAHHHEPSSSPIQTQPSLVTSYNPSSTAFITEARPNTQQLPVSHTSQPSATEGYHSKEQSPTTSTCLREPTVTYNHEFNETKTLHEDFHRKDSCQSGNVVSSNSVSVRDNHLPLQEEAINSRESHPVIISRDAEYENHTNVPPGDTEESIVLIQRDTENAFGDRFSRERESERYESSESEENGKGEYVSSHEPNILDNQEENFSEPHYVVETSCSNNEPLLKNEGVTEDGASQQKPVEDTTKNNYILETQDLSQGSSDDGLENSNSDSEKAETRQVAREERHSFQKFSDKENDEIVKEKRSINEDHSDILVNHSATAQICESKDDGDNDSDFFDKDVPSGTSKSYKNILGVVGGSSIQTESDSDDIEGQLMMSSFTINPAKRPTFRPMASTIPSLKPAPPGTDTDSVDSVEAAIQAAMNKPKADKVQDLSKDQEKSASSPVAADIAKPSEDTQQVIAGTAPRIEAGGGKTKSSGALALKLDSDSESYGVSGGDNESDDDFDFYD